VFKKILVCLDGSDLAEHVLPHVSDMVEQGPTRVVLLKVLPETIGGVTGVSQKTPWTMQQRAEEYLRGLASPLEAAGIEVSCVTMLGKAEEVIIRYARENQIDLIAMATHGRGGLQNTLFGSVAQHVLRESGLPMLLIRPSLTTLRRVERAQVVREPAVQQ
jgi:nucleotide-binding universal stress UspA family protein